MQKTLRSVLDVAKREGLEPLSVDHGSKHILLRLSNGVDVMTQTVSRLGEPNWQDMRNLRAQFRRFARGMTHGLRVELKKGNG